MGLQRREMEVAAEPGRRCWMLMWNHLFAFETQTSRRGSEQANMKKMKSALWRKIHKIKDFLIANLHAAASNFCPFAG